MGCTLRFFTGEKGRGGGNKKYLEEIWKLGIYSNIWWKCFPKEIWRGPHLIRDLCSTYDWIIKKTIYRWHESDQSNQITLIQRWFWSCPSAVGHHHKFWAWYPFIFEGSSLFQLRVWRIYPKSHGHNISWKLINCFWVQICTFYISPTQMPEVDFWHISISGLKLF